MNLLNPKSKIQRRLSGLYDFTGFEAAGANTDSQSAPTDKSTYGLKIRIKAAVRPVVGVAHSMTELWPLAADFTAFGHRSLPPMRNL